jgi:hypothetical protein
MMYSLVCGIPLVQWTRGLYSKGSRYALSRTPSNKHIKHRACPEHPLHAPLPRPPPLPWPPALHAGVLSICCVHPTPSLIPSSAGMC